MKKYSLKEDGPAIAFLFLLTAVFFLPVLVEGNSQILSSAGTDTWSQYFYWRHFGFNTLAKGDIPLWNPFIFSGTPYIAGIQSAIFYPPNAVFLLFQPAFAINLSIALHCFLTSLFTYLFVRYLDISRAGAILSAIAFAYGAPYFFHIYPGHLSNLSTMAWLPLVFLGIEAFLKNRDVKFAVLSGLPLSLQVLAGHPQYLFYSMIAVSLYFFTKLLIILATEGWRMSLRLFSGFCIFVTLGLLLSSIQLFPALELAKNSVRESLSYEWVSVFSLPPEKLITLLVPDFFGDMLRVPYWGKNYLWEMSIYIGVIPFVLALTGFRLIGNRNVAIFSLIAAISLTLALGKHTPLLKLLYTHVPGFDMFRGLSKFIFTVSFSLSVIAGFGLDYLVKITDERGPRIQRLSYAVLIPSVLFIFIGLMARLYGYEMWKSLIASFTMVEERYTLLPPLTGEFLERSFSLVLRGLLRSASLLILLGVSLLVFCKVKRSSRTALVIFILSLTSVDLWGFGFRYLATFDPRSLGLDSELKKSLKSDKEPFRIATPVFSLLNVGMLDGIENVGGYDAIVLKRYSEFINLAQGLPLDRPNIVMEIQRVSPLLRLLNARYYVLEPQMSIDLPGFDLFFRNESYKVYRDNNALPRSFVVHNVKVIKGRDAIFRELARPDYNPGTLAIVEKEIDTPLNRPDVVSPTPRFVEYSPNRVVIDAYLNAPGLLILGDTYYPGWKAFVDGKGVKVFPANYVMRGVILSEGRHTVEFRYEPLSFKIGAVISLMTLTFMVGFLIWNRRNR